jgi:hypothetical protein
VDLQNEAASLMDELITPIPVEISLGDLQPSKEVLVQQLHPIAPEQKLPPYVLPTSGTN